MGEGRKEVKLFFVVEIFLIYGRILLPGGTSVTVYGKRLGQECLALYMCHVDSIRCHKLKYIFSSVCYPVVSRDWHWHHPSPIAYTQTD